MQAKITYPNLGLGRQKDTFRNWRNSMPWSTDYNDRGDGYQEKVNTDNGEKIVTASGQTDRMPHVHTYPDGNWVARDAGGVAWGSNEHASNVSTAAAAALGADFSEAESDPSDT